MSHPCPMPMRLSGDRRHEWATLLLALLLHGVAHADDAFVDVAPGTAQATSGPAGNAAAGAGGDDVQQVIVPNSAPASVPAAGPAFDATTPNPGDAAGTAPAPSPASGGGNNNAAPVEPPAGPEQATAAPERPPAPECQATPYAQQSPSGLLAGQADFTPYAGMTIGKVQLDRLPVFDETNRRENLLLYRFLNDAHVTSRDATIRRQLLFTPGEALLPRHIEETERNLRQNAYIADARIVPLQVCGTTVDLLVVTRDTWGLEPGASFSHSGGTSNSGFTLKDTNFLGTGDAIAVDFTHTPERDSVDYEIDAHSLFGARIDTTVHYVNTSDGRIRSLVMARPFFALDTPWSAGGSYYQEARIDTGTTGGATVSRFQHDINKYETFGGFSPGLQGNYSNRYLLGVAREQDQFAPVDPAFPDVPADRKLTYPWVGFESTENRFAVYHNISYINRTEDVALGKHFSARIGYGARAFDNSVPQWKFSGAYSDAPDVGRHHLLKFEGHVDGGWLSDAGSFENTVAGGSLAYHYLIDDKNRWFARLAMEAGSGLTEDKLLGIGGIADLRGYPTDFQRGDRRYVINLERRYYSSLHLMNLIRAGSVVFVDAGQAWNSREGLNVKPEYDAGFGLRLSSSKAHTGRVLHLDYAFPLKDQERIAKSQWLLKVQESF